MRPPRGGVTGTKVVGNLTNGRNPVRPPRGVPDPETKVRGNFMNRKDPKTKLLYGVGKCLKYAKKPK